MKTAHSTLGVFIGGSRYQETTEGPFKFALSQVTIDENQNNMVRHLSMPFFPHGFAIDPLNENRLFCYEKIGLGAAEVDLKKWHVKRVIKPQKDRSFYGHGAVSSNGKLLYSTETNTITGAGFIGIRDTKTLAYMGDFPSFGDHPHDCHLADNGKILLVTNGGGDEYSGQLGNLSYIDIASKRLIAQHTVLNKRFNVGHVEPTTGCALILSAPRRGLDTTYDGAIHLLKDNQLITFTNPAIKDQLKGEALSGIISSEHNLIVVTHPTPGLVTCWQLDTQKLRKVLQLPLARGIALTNNRQEFVISFDASAKIKRFCAKTLTEIANSEIINTLIGGSHLINWSALKTT